MVDTRSRKRSATKENDEREAKTSENTSIKKSAKRIKRSPAKGSASAKGTGLDTSNRLRDEDIASFVEHSLKKSGIERTKTRNGWCLKEAMACIVKADNGRMVPLIEKNGAPSIFSSLQHCKNSTGNVEKELAAKPKNCFESLCRIVAGQQLAGSSASAMWRRLLDTAAGKLTPERILELVQDGIEEGLRVPARLSKAKAVSIVSIARAFHEGTLSEDFLKTSDETKIREELMKIKGIGPWSCDMFCIFFLELPDVFPVGDLGVRRGIQKYFNLKGSDKYGYLCQKRDIEKIEKTFKPFAPFRSVVASYMWRVVDTEDVYHSNSSTGKKH